MRIMGAVRCWTGGADEESVGVRAQANTGHGIGGGGPPVIRYLVMRLLGVVAVVWIIGSVTFIAAKSSTCSEMPIEIARAGCPGRPAATFTAVLSMP